MATWQASFAVKLPGRRMPAGYRDLLRKVLEEGRSWSGDLEVWGTEAGDRIDVWHPGADEHEVLARFDMRTWDAQLYLRFIEFVRIVNGTIQVAPGDQDMPEVAPTIEAFEAALRASDAFRFVSNPEAYLRRLPLHDDVE
jgi:hypothetical protein